MFELQFEFHLITYKEMANLEALYITIKINLSQKAAKKLTAGASKISRN